MIDPVGPVIPVVPLVIRPRSLLKMLGIDAQPVMAAMANHIIEAKNLVVQSAEDKAVGIMLMCIKAYFLWRGLVRDDTPLFCSLPLTHQTAGKGFGFFGMVRQDIQPALFGVIKVGKVLAHGHMSPVR